MDYVRKFLNIEGVIGQGAFGRVLVTSPLQQQQQQQQDGNNQSITSNSNTKFALKCVYPILRPQRLANELRQLRDLGGSCNVVQLHSAHFDTGALYIVTELIEHNKFVDIVAELTYEEIVMYMKNLLIALEHVHRHNIVHRDIKPANFLFNRKDRKFLLVDFGLAQKVFTAPVANKATPTTPTTKTSTPNVPTKRQLPFAQEPLNKSICSRSGDRTEALPFGQLKRLRLSNGDKPFVETREPVKLTVGAYESPVTHNEHRNHKFSTPTIPLKHRTPNSKCDCRGKPKTCSTCLLRPESNAPKSGTPGYKAPEILLRYSHQTTAIDMWSSGVILVCLLSGHSPFFRDVEDTISLAEIITILGSHKVTKAAEALNIRLNIKPDREPVNLVQMCKTIRMNNKEKRQIDFPDCAFDLLHRMLNPNPLTRITASEALKHPFFQSV